MPRTFLDLMNDAQKGTAAPLVVPDFPAFNTYASDGAISLVNQIGYLTKGSAGAYTVNAPGAANIRITLVAGTDFAHVITFTGGTLKDGTTGAKTTVTMTAFIGSCITFFSVSTTQWVVESKDNLTSIA